MKTRDSRRMLHIALNQAIDEIQSIKTSFRLGEDDKARRQVVKVVRLLNRTVEERNVVGSIGESEEVCSDGRG